MARTRHAVCPLPTWYTSIDGSMDGEKRRASFLASPPGTPPGSQPNTLTVIRADRQTDRHREQCTPYNRLHSDHNDQQPISHSHTHDTTQLNRQNITQPLNHSSIRPLCLCVCVCCRSTARVICRGLSCPNRNKTGPMVIGAVLFPLAQISDRQTARGKETMITHTHTRALCSRLVHPTRPLVMKHEGKPKWMDGWMDGRMENQQNKHTQTRPSCLSVCLSCLS